MIPLALAVVAFSTANRNYVVISLWPAPFTIEAPLALIVLSAIAAGTIIGFILAGLSGMRARRRAKMKKSMQMSVRPDSQTKAQARPQERHKERHKENFPETAGGRAADSRLHGTDQETAAPPPVLAAAPVILPPVTDGRQGPPASGG